MLQEKDLSEEESRILFPLMNLNLNLGLVISSALPSPAQFKTAVGACNQNLEEYLKSKSLGPEKEKELKEKITKAMLSQIDMLLRKKQWESCYHVIQFKGLSDERKDLLLRNLALLTDDYRYLKAHNIPMTSLNQLHESHGEDRQSGKKALLQMALQFRPPKVNLAVWLIKEGVELQGDFQYEPTKKVGIFNYCYLTFGKDSAIWGALMARAAELKNERNTALLKDLLNEKNSFNGKKIACLIDNIFYAGDLNTAQVMLGNYLDYLDIDRPECLLRNSIFSKNEIKNSELIKEAVSFCNQSQRTEVDFFAAMPDLGSFIHIIAKMFKEGQTESLDELFKLQPRFEEKALLHWIFILAFWRRMDDLAVYINQMENDTWLSDADIEILHKYQNQKQGYRDCSQSGIVPETLRQSSYKTITYQNVVDALSRRYPIATASFFSELTVSITIDYKTVIEEALHQTEGTTLGYIKKSGFSTLCIAAGVTDHASLQALKLYAAAVVGNLKDDRVQGIRQKLTDLVRNNNATIQELKEALQEEEATHPFWHRSQRPEELRRLLEPETVVSRLLQFSHLTRRFRGPESEERRPLLNSTTASINLSHVGQ